MPQKTLKDRARVALEGERAAYRALLEVAEEVLPLRPSSSTRHADEIFVRSDHADAESALIGLLNSSVHNVMHSLIVMDEYLEGVLALLERETLRTYPATSMSRSIHEGVLVLCRTFDSNLTTNQRLVRMAALDVKTRLGAQAGFRSFAGPQSEDELRLREHTDEFITYLEGAGFKMSRKHSRPDLLTGITWAGIQEDLTTDGTTGASRTYTPEIHFNWVIGSAATHSKKWFLHGQEGSTDESVKTLMLPLLDLSRILMRCLGTYFGIDVEKAIKTTSFRIRAILLHDAEQTLTSVANIARAKAWDGLNPR